MKTGTGDADIMKKRSAIAENAMVLNGTLIQYVCNPGRTVVPASALGLRIRRIGNGALFLKDTEELFVSEGIEEIGEGNFTHGTDLKAIHFPWTMKTVSQHAFCEFRTKKTIYWEIEMSRQGIQELVSGPGKTDDPASFYVSKSDLLRPELCNIRNLRMEAAKLLPQIELNGYPEMLFEWDGKSGMWEPEWMFEQRLFFMQGHKPTMTTEYDVIMNMIRTGRTGWLDPESEAYSDRLCALGRNPAMEALGSNPAQWASGCMITGCVTRQDRAMIMFSMSHFYMPALHRIRYGGRDWWLYCRNLFSRPRVSMNKFMNRYIRQDVGIFSPDGLVMDREVSEMIYTKFRMISSL